MLSLIATLAKPCGSRAASSPNASAWFSAERIIELVAGVSRYMTTREDGEGERQTRRIGEIAHAPAFAVPPLEPAVQAVDDPVADPEREREPERQPERVVQFVVPHLVAHHGADLGQRRAVHQVVVQGDARRPAEAGDIRADAFRLLRGVVPEHVVRGNVRFARERQDRIADFAVRQAVIVVE